MRFGFRALVVASLSLLMAIACVGGENQCLNPQPDLPSCRNGNLPGGSMGGSTSSAAGGNNNGNAFAGSPAMTAGGSGLNVGDDAGPPKPNEGAAGESGAFAGAGGDSSGEPVGHSAGAGGAAGAAGAAGSDDGS
jgi:hypothetical protein